MAEHGFVQAAAIDGGLIVKKPIRGYLTTKVSKNWEDKKRRTGAFFCLVESVSARNPEQANTL